MLGRIQSEPVDDRWASVASAAAPRGLGIVGGFHPGPDDSGLSGHGTILLIGPDEPTFWNVFQASTEASDGLADPLDRWSRRELDAIADETGATATFFPFGGPPWHPFIGWALRTGQVWTSPVGLLVSAKAGLWVSFRGALGFPEKIDLHSPPPKPCDSCAAPCLSACPVNAFADRAYDTEACHAHLDTGPDCLNGCRVRRACPVAPEARLTDQSRFHMTAFHPVTTARGT